MPSFIIDLDTLAETESSDLDRLVTQVQVQPGFVDELKQTFGGQFDSEHGLAAEFPVSSICEQAWEDNGDSKRIQEHIASLSERLHPIQKSDKGLLFHSTDSEILVAHYHENEGWVNDSGALINGERVDKDSVISMFALESANDDLDGSVVNADYYTDSTTFMRIFNVLSNDTLQEIPEREVYLNGDPVYDERYLVRYSFERNQCIEMLDDGSLSLDSGTGTFTLEKQHDAEPRPFEYTFNGGRFGLSRSETLWRFEREYIQYKHGWLTAKRVYRHLVNEEGPYEESRINVELSDSTIRKCEEQTDRGHVVFAKHDDEGVLTQEFADAIIRAIVGKQQYRLYFASHQDGPEHEALRLNSRNHTFVFSNISTASIEEEVDKLQLMYDQATDESLRRARRYMTAAGLLIGLSTVSGTAAAESLEDIVAPSSYGGLQGYVEQKLETTESPDAFQSSLNAYFDTVGTDTQPATLLGDGFDYNAFQRLVGMIDKAGRSLELSSGDFTELDEEGYRSVITASVGQRIDGNLTREAETGRGPSDIRLRDGNGEVIYLGECKYWTKTNTGAEYNVKKPLEQLDTYNQHQLFDSIIIFFKSDDYSRIDVNTIWEDAEEKIGMHDTTFSLEDEMSETPRSRIYKRQLSEGDGDRYLSIHVFDVGTEQHHESDAAEEEASA